MLPIANRPLLEHLVADLRTRGTGDIYVNLHHLPEVITEYFGDGAAWGVRITWRHEPVLSGPAGALLAFEDLLSAERQILVVSGDALHNVDLGAFAAEHVRSGARLSVVMKETTGISRYGVGIVDADGSLRTFVQKPPAPPERVGLVSCGLYCLDGDLLRRFPRRAVYDFGTHLIPELLAEGEPVHAFVTTAYWSDIGEPTTLRQANLDAVSGVVRVAPHGVEARPGVWIEDGARIEATARVEGPVVIGRSASIAAEAEVYGPAVIGNNVRIGQGAFIRSSLLLPGAVVGDGAVIIDGVLAASP